MVGINRNAWKTILILSRRNSAKASSFIRAKSSLSIIMDPDVAASNPPMIIINVDFPAPDGPVIATAVSEQMSREIPFSISTFPALLPSSSFTSFICIKGLLELSIPEDDLLCFIAILCSDSIFYYNLQTWEYTKRCIFYIVCQC